MYGRLHYKKIGIALNNTHKFLNDNHILHSEHEEYLQFIEFYKIFFQSMNFKKYMTKECQKLAHEPVVTDGNIITSYYPQTAPEVAFRLLEMLTDKETADFIRIIMGYSSC